MHPMSTPSTSGYPEPFVPSIPAPSSLERFVAIFSRAGRMRRLLWRASAAPSDLQALEQLKAAVLRIPMHRWSEPDLADLIRTVLLYLTWRSLQSGASDEAGRWL